MESIALEDGNGTGLGAEKIDKDLEVEPPPACEDSVAMDTDSNVIETQKAVHFDPQSVGETIDDIVNELKCSGVVMDVDIPINSCSSGQAEVPPADVSKHNGAGNGDETHEEESFLENTSLTTTATLSSPASFEEDKNIDKDATQQPIMPEEQEQLAEGSPADASTAEESAPEIAATSEAEEHDGSEEKEEKAHEPDGSTSRTTGEQSDGASVSDEETGRRQSPRRPSSSIKRGSKAGSTPKRRKRHSILKVSVAGMLGKKPAGPKKSQRATAEERRSPKHTNHLQNVAEEDSSEDESLIQLAKRSRMMKDDAGDKEGKTKVKATKKRPHQKKKALKNTGNEEEVKEEGSIKSEDDSPVQIARRSRKIATEGTEDNDKNDVHDVEEEHKIEMATKVAPQTKKAPNKTVMFEEETEETKPGTSTSDVCDWSFEEFVESDGYLRDVIGRSLGRTSGRFLTIELPDEDTVRRRRAWRAPRARRSRPVVFGGCDPNQVHINVMGVKVPIYCWSQVDHITPKVLVTDIFEDMVHQQSSWCLD